MADMNWVTYKAFCIFDTIKTCTYNLSKFNLNSFLRSVYSFRKIVFKTHGKLLQGIYCNKIV